MPFPCHRFQRSFGTGGGRALLRPPPRRGVDAVADLFEVAVPLAARVSDPDDRILSKGQQLGLVGKLVKQTPVFRARRAHLEKQRPLVVPLVMLLAGLQRTDLRVGQHVGYRRFR